MFKDQRIGDDYISWTPTPDAVSPWQYEWNHFIDSIRNDKPHNEAKRAIYSDMTTLMGRAACHIGQEVTWDQMMQSDFQFCGLPRQTDPREPRPRQGRRKRPVPRSRPRTLD